MPPPPPVADLPAASVAARLVEDPYAGTLPASALEQLSMMSVQTRRSDPPLHIDARMPSVMPSTLGAQVKDFARTDIRTVDGEPKTLGESAPVGKTQKTGSKTVIDDAPTTSMSRSTIRTPRPLAAFLVSFQYEPLGTYWPLGAGSNLVGRTGGGRPDLDVGIGDTTVSSEQAVVELDSLRPGTLIATVEDRSSRNGTAINGQAIPAGARIAVTHGDRIRFGSFETVLVLVPYPATS